MKILRAVFIAQLVVMLPVFVFLIATHGNVYTFLLLFYVAPPGLVVALYALWQFIKHPDRRRLAFATGATPLICLGAPWGIYALNGGPVSPAVLIPAIIVLIAIGIYVLLGKTHQWRGSGVFANKRLNVVYVLSLGILLALLWLPVITWLAARDSIPVPDDIAERDQLIRIVGYYFIAVAVPAFCLSLFGVFYAPVGLWRNRGGRLVHFGQLVLTLMLLVTLTAFAFVVFLGMANPG